MVELTKKRVIELLVAAAVILTLFTLKYRGVFDRKVAKEPEKEEFVTLSPYDEIFRQYADSVYDWKLLAAIAYVETKYDSSLVSPMGATGIMQIMPPTYLGIAKELGIDPDSMCTEYDVMVAAEHLHILDEAFSFINQRERINFVLGSYNGGQAHIFDAMRIARRDGINRYNWKSLEPVLMSLNDESVYTDSICRNGKFDATETIGYVRKVQKKYSEYRQLDLLFKALQNLPDTLPATTLYLRE